MGEPNNVLKTYMKKPERIRAILEYYLGENLPKDWVISGAEDFYARKNSKGKFSFRQRDVFKRILAGNFSFLLGLENQETINLIYPWRLMEMDCLEYEAGIEEIQEKNQAAKVKYAKGDDFKYHYRKMDRLEPVLNLTLYWGREVWQEPRSLGDMVDRGRLPKKLGRLFEDYRIHLIQMRQIPEEDLQKMDSDLKYVLGIMKRTSSKKAYQRYVEENKDFFSRIPKSAADVICVYANMKDIRRYLEFRASGGEEEEADMCKALRDIKRDARREGRQEGRQEGRLEGKLEGRAEEIIVSGYEFGLSEENILERLQRRMSISEKTAQGYIKRFGKQPV